MLTVSSSSTPIHGGEGSLQNEKQSESADKLEALGEHDGGILEAEDERILGIVERTVQRAQEIRKTPNGFRRARTSKHKLQRQPKKKRR